MIVIGVGLPSTENVSAYTAIATVAITSLYSAHVRRRRADAAARDDDDDGSMSPPAVAVGLSSRRRSAAPSKSACGCSTSAAEPPNW